MADKRKSNSKITGSRTPALDLLSYSKPGSRVGTLQSPSDLRKLSGLGADRILAAPIAFGKPSASSDTRGSAAGGVNWQSLLTKGTQSGFSAKFGGGLLGFGLSSLFSGIADLFGGDAKQEEPLTPFTLSDPQNATIYRSSRGLSGIESEGSTDRAGRVGTYANRNTALGQAGVVKAVKQALLTSSSLNDIIGDL